MFINYINGMLYVLYCISLFSQNIIFVRLNYVDTAMVLYCTGSHHYKIGFYEIYICIYGQCRKNVFRLPSFELWRYISREEGIQCHVFSGMDAMSWMDLAIRFQPITWCHLLSQTHSMLASS